MNDTRRIAMIACFMLVTLRLMIGWQLLYEGLWKVKTLKSPTPWTAAGYLKNSKGPFRDYFRQLAGDADDLSLVQAKLIDPEETNPEKFRYWVPGVETKWDRWRDRFVKHYGLKGTNQEKRLNFWLNGVNEFAVELADIPDDAPGLNADKNRIKSLNFDSDAKRLNYKGHLLPGDRAKIEAWIDADSDGIPNNVDANAFDPDEDEIADADEDGILDEADVDATGGKDENGNGIDDSTEAEKQVTYLAAVKSLFKKSKDGLSYKKKLRATVAGNPDWISDESGQRVGEIEKYKIMLANYEEDLAAAKQSTSEFPFSDESFRFDHLQHNWGKIQAKRAELIGPVKGLEKELMDKAENMLSVEQLKRGPVPDPFWRWSALKASDMMTIAGLTILGAMLILGVWTRFAAIMAAVMLFMFYAAMPPWPGVPAIPGPEHSFIVNKNFIEVIALLAIAALPTGRWFGVDGILSGLWARRRAKKQAALQSN